MRFSQDVTRDSVLVYSGMKGMAVQMAIFKLGWTPEELHAHSLWLRKQPESYLTQVVAAVETIMDTDG